MGVFQTQGQDSKAGVEEHIEEVEEDAIAEVCPTVLEEISKETQVYFWLPCVLDRAALQETPYSALQIGILLATLARHWAAATSQRR